MFIGECKFANNTAIYTGALSISHAIAIITATTITDNVAQETGRAMSINVGTVHIERSIFAYNSGYAGGVITASSSNISVANSTFQDNTADHSALCFAADKTSLSTNDVIIKNNVALNILDKE